MKKLLLSAIILLLGTATFAQVDVNFSVDMGVQVFEGLFDPATDLVVVRGDFQDEAGDTGGDWQGDYFAMDDGDGDTIYTVTATIPDTFIDSTFQFKFVISPDGWESVDNRVFVLEAPVTNLPVYWFNNDSVYNQIDLVQNTFNFTADISDILGVGADGAFDPEQDSLLVMGLDWDGLGTLISDPADRRMENTDPFNSGIYTASLTVEGPLGDSTKWKFKAFPDARFSNNGWESGGDRWLTFLTDGTVIDLPTIVPRIQPLYDAITSDINITFRVDMTNAVNRYNNEPIDPATVEFVGLRGGAEFLGDWSAGCWCLDDTTNGVMKVLNDNGQNGDVTAGDDIWSIIVTAPSGQPGGLYEYKFAAYYPGADTVNGGSSPLDNEGGFGINHNFVLVDGPDQVYNLDFGDFSTDVEKIDDLVPGEFGLSQNYPNPFNPSTTIEYNVPKTAVVNLTIYNILGQKVKTIVNNMEQTPGVYKITFDASRLASGIYFYTLSTESFVSTKKMILMK